MERKSVCKSFTICGADGNHVSISETVERGEVVLTIQQNDERGRLATVRLDREQFRALADTYYSLEIIDETDVPTASLTDLATL